MQSKPATERFWKHVDKQPGGCWVWTAATNHKGYGTYRDNEGAFVRAHRFSFVMAGNTIPKGMLILHKCDNPPCVNPMHLFAGTHTDNMRDAIEKGRFSGGVTDRVAKLNPKAVVEMRNIHSAGKMGFLRISKQFGVSKKAAKKAILRQTWKHVP